MCHQLGMPKTKTAEIPAEAPATRGDANAWQTGPGQIKPGQDGLCCSNVSRK